MRLRLLLAGLLAAATELSGVGLIATATWLIVRASGRPPMAALAVAIVAVRAFALTKGGLRYAERLAGHDAVLRVLADFRTRVFAALVVPPGPDAGPGPRSASARLGAPVPRQRRRGGPVGFAGLHRADLLARVVSDVDAIQDVLLRVALPAGVAVVVSGVGVLGAGLVSPVAALVLAVGLVSGGLVVPGLGYLAGRASAAPLASARAATGVATVDVLHGVADLAVFGALPGAVADVRRRAQEVARGEARAGAIAGGVSALAGAVPLLTAIVMALVAPASSMALLALGALAVGEVVVPLAGAAVRQAELGGALARIAPLLGGSSVVDGGVEGVTRGSGTIAENDARVPDVLVEHVTVRYAADGPAVLDDVSLRIPAGARIAVIGSSGAGKSTLLAAIAGAVPLTGGVVRGAGVGWPLVGGVFADAHVFHATVRENVSLGRDDVTDGDVSDALTAAGLELDLDAVVGEDGAQVSGGQRQRLLLARALVRTPPVLLLDEPTEGLDSATADAVLDSALAAAGASTIVVVTHRYANLDRFAEIVRLEEGRLVALDVADVGG